MAYTKPQVIAQNSSTGSYAAGCPANTNSINSGINAQSTWKIKLPKYFAITIQMTFQNYF